MNIDTLIDQLISQTLQRDIPAFMPEIVICITILVVLLIRLVPYGDRLDSMWPTLLGSCAALWFLIFPSGWITSSPLPAGEIFGGLLVYDTFSLFVRGVLLLFLILFCPLTKLTGVPGKYESADIYTLFLGGVLGMCLMASANHLLTVFVAVEMASVPSYALAGLFKHRKESSEASLKYAVYGAGAAGIMLYGISLLAGLTNSAHLPTIALQLSDMVTAGELGGSEGMVLSIAGLMIMVGLAFKLSAVPFHFWCPDVFHGASAEVNAYLSVASKAAALALLVRVAMGLGMVTPWINGPLEAAAPEPSAEQTSSSESTVVPVQLAAYQADTGEVAESTAPASDSVEKTTESSIVTPEQQLTVRKNLTPIRDFMAKMIALIAAITCTFGNLAAYGQTNIKRLLAYSTIAHAGYMMMAVPAAIILTGYDLAASGAAVAALSLYISVYLFMNLGAFAIVALLRNSIGSEEIADYAGLIRRSPGVVICFALILFSLVGLPPLAGFLGKYAIFAALANGFTVTQASGQAANFLLVLLLVGGINTAISLYYYLRVVKVMTMDPEPTDRVPFQFSMVSIAGVYITLITLPTAFLMLSWDWLNLGTLNAVEHLLK